MGETSMESVGKLGYGKTKMRHLKWKASVTGNYNILFNRLSTMPMV